MKTRLLPLMLLAGGSLFAAPHVSIGIGLGAPAYYPPAPPVVVDSRPPCPGPGYSWVNGYWANGAWTAGYWAAPYNAYVAPRYPEFRHDRDDHFRDRDRGHDGDRDHDRGRASGNGFRR